MGGAAVLRSRWPRRCWTTALAIALVPAAACGDDRAGAPVDGVVPPDAGSDGGPGDCLVETDDLGNGVTPEATGLVFAGQRIALCGTIDPGHAAGDLIDVDRYTIGVSPGAAAVIRLTAPLGGQLDRIDLTVGDGGGPAAVARFRGGHAVIARELADGAYTLSVEARAAVAPGPVPYRIEVAPDQPELRCPADTQPATHDEVDESAAYHRANDVVAVRLTPALVAVPTTGDDQPDATGVAVSAGGRLSVAGTSAEVAPDGDDYHDRDTFSFHTGARVNQLDVRATAPGSGADLDVLVFEAGVLDQPMGAPVAAPGADELMATAVSPSTQYWLWVGGSRSSTALPAPYVLYVCGREVTPAAANQ